MPNWTSNLIRVEGRKADLRKFLQAVKWENKILDFNRIIPMPELLQHTGSGSRIIDGQEVRSWYIIKPFDFSKPEEPEQVRLFTPEEETQLEAIGHRDWYSWSKAHWGTKWNACQTELSADSIGRGHIEIRFDTAWDAPMPIFTAMARKFPKLFFTFQWRHEDEYDLDDGDYSYFFTSNTVSKE